MQKRTSLKPWPFLIYDRWAAFLRLQIQRQELAVDLLSVLKDPPYEALSTGDHRGIIFGVEGVDDYPNSTEGLFQLWVDRLEPDSAFDLDLLADVVAKARTAGIGEDSWTDYEERMSQSRRRPLRHPMPVQSILEESRGFLFYRDQPGRVLALILDLSLHNVDDLLKGRASVAEADKVKRRFVQRLVEFDASVDYAESLWDSCLSRYRYCLPRDYVDARRSQMLWCLAVRQLYPKLFEDSWRNFVKTL
jgi:DNA polymerase III alpha subunit